MISAADMQVVGCPEAEAEVMLMEWMRSISARYCRATGSVLMFGSLFAGSSGGRPGAQCEQRQGAHGTVSGRTARRNGGDEWSIGNWDAPA